MALYINAVFGFELQKSAHQNYCVLVEPKEVERALPKTFPALFAGRVPPTFKFVLAPLHMTLTEATPLVLTKAI